MPAGPDPISTVDADYVPVSAEVPLEPGQKIADLYDVTLSSEFVLQRLTERTWWVQRYFYGTTFYVGDEGVLLFDPLDGHGEALLAAIRSVTDKPVRAVVYSHAHADHIGDTAATLSAVGGDVDVVASRATADKLAFLGSSLPAPTTVLDWPQGSYAFEDLTLALHGFTRPAHCDDHSAWLLEQERVLHTPDLLNPDQPPFWHFAGSENYLYLRSNLQDVAALDWTWVNGGHGNVGGPEDVAFHLRAFDDYEAAARAAMEAHPFSDFVDPTSTRAHTSFMVNWLDAVVAAATDALRPTYGRYYGFEQAAPSNLSMVAHTLFSYR